MPEPQTIPAPDADGSDLVITIRLGADGRLYFHDLTADMLPVACALCPDDLGLQVRQRIAVQAMEVRHAD